MILLLNYHSLSKLIFVFSKQICFILLDCSEELKEKYDGKMELAGPTYKVLGKVMGNIINRKVTNPGAFIG